MSTPEQRAQALLVKSRNGAHASRWGDEAHAIIRDLLSENAALRSSQEKTRSQCRQLFEYVMQMADLLGPTSQIAEEARLRRPEWQAFLSSLTAQPQEQP
jgi:hypothetical protein